MILGRENNERIEACVRIYRSLRYFIGENKVYPPGDVLCVSMKNNDKYDLFLTADGKSTFRELLQQKRDDNEYDYVKVRHIKDPYKEYDPIVTPSELEKSAGKDISIYSSVVANALSADKPYFRNILVKDSDISHQVVIKAIEKAILDNIVVSGEKGETNGKITFAANELLLKDISIKGNSTLYNAFEGYQRMDDPQYSGISNIIAENLDIDCPTLTHNIINVYTPASGAEIIIRNSMFNLTVDNSNVLRLSNYLNAENVKVTFENCEWTYENGVSFNDWGWAGLVIYQPAASDVALNGDTSKLKTWKFVFRNCKYNGEKVTGNNFGQHNQVVYLYNMNRDNKVSDPAEYEIDITFE